MTIEPQVVESWDHLQVRIYRDREQLGRAAAAAVAEDLHAAYRQATPAGLVAVFASAPSQRELLAELRALEDLPWHATTAFHIDEYLDVSRSDPSSFATYLDRHLFDHILPKTVHYLDGTAPPEQEAARYAGLLRQHPLDVACIGIGENGHLAFNDPPVADFDDPLWVKEVVLESESRQQQVNDGMFASLDEVPQRALTVTIPALLAVARIHCVVPGKSKAEAVRQTLLGPIASSCPASVLRRHAGSTLYLDPESASLLPLRVG